jgi:hypothetical protein
MPITTTPSGGAQGEYSTYTPIYAQTLSSSASSITFSNIPTTFTDLRLVIGGITTATGYAFTVRVNGDTGSNYSQTLISSNGTNAQSARYSSASDASMYLGGWVNGYDTSGPQTITADFINYSNANTFKSILWRSGVGSRNAEAGVMLWRNTNPITTIQVVAQSGSSMAANSTFTLYGIKAATPAPKATGGDVVYTDNTYWYHVFNSSGVLDVKTSMNVDYLVVAGGGGGAHSSGTGSGGGGAGGYRTSIGGSQLSVTATAYPITVGAGGAGSTSLTVLANGSNSVFSTITSTGGGGGGIATATPVNGGNGGSGGGGSAYFTNNKGLGNTPSTSPSQGNDGANGISLNINSGGGGGGASAAGSSGSGTVAGNGGAGTANSISGVSVTYAGGGGGGAETGTAGTGGAGGGGNGSIQGAGTNGTINLGGGGGGSGDPMSGASAASGGSGIVIVRYAV